MTRCWYVAGGPVVVGRVSYCSQVPWIMAATIRENITFQQPFDQIRYDSVIAACALEQDLVELEAGDATELGERGINLSGRQHKTVRVHCVHVMAVAACCSCGDYKLHLSITSALGTSLCRQCCTWVVMQAGPWGYYFV
jgi:hypothetical protein